MKVTLAVSLILIATFVIAVQSPAKEKAVRITVKGSDLPNTVEITDPKILENFDVWTGPGTSPNEAEGFIIQWSRGVISDAPKGLQRYQISFYSEHSPERPFYVVFYSYDASSEQGYVYLPGPGETFYSQNVSAIVRGVEGKWFHARPTWDTAVEQLFAKAKVKAAK
jgi:hypothetical protein